MTIEDAMATLYLTWPHRAETPEQMALTTHTYRGALADLTPDELATSVSRCVEACRHFPVPAELRGLARPTREPELDYDPLRDATPTALLAPPRPDAAATEHPAWASVCCPDCLGSGNRGNCPTCDGHGIACPACRGAGWVADHTWRSQGRMTPTRCRLCRGDRLFGRQLAATKLGR